MWSKNQDISRKIRWHLTSSSANQSDFSMYVTIFWISLLLIPASTKFDWISLFTKTLILQPFVVLDFSFKDLTK